MLRLLGTALFALSVAASAGAAELPTRQSHATPRCAIDPALTAPTSVRRGATHTWRLSVRNRGREAVRRVRVRALLPQGALFPRRTARLRVSVNRRVEAGPVRDLARGKRVALGLRVRDTRQDRAQGRLRVKVSYDCGGRRRSQWARLALTPAVDGEALRRQLSSAAYGPRQRKAPADSVAVTPGTDLRAIMLANDAGTTYFLTPGVHRLDRELDVIEDGDRLIGAGPSTRISGAGAFEWSFDEGARLFYIDGQGQEDVGISEQERELRCRLDAPECYRADQVFVDGTGLRQASSREQLTDGVADNEEFWFDYGADRIWFARAPSKAVEATSFWPLIGVQQSGQPRYAVEDLVIERTSGSYAAPSLFAFRNARYTRVHFRQLGEAVHVGRGSRVTRSILESNGLYGVTSIDDELNGTSPEDGPLIFERNNIYANNTKNWNDTWGAGGSKFVGTANARIRLNWFHDNNGPGIWCDIDCRDVTIDRNVTENNGGAGSSPAASGIFYEISFGGRITSNYVAGNTEHGIQISNSTDTTVTGNTVVDNAQGGIHLRQYCRSEPRWQLKDVRITGNDVTTGGGHVGDSQWPQNKLVSFDVARDIASGPPCSGYSDGTWSSDAVDTWYFYAGVTIDNNRYRAPASARRGPLFRGWSTDSTTADNLTWGQWKAQSRQDARSQISAR